MSHTWYSVLASELLVGVLLWLFLRMHSSVIPYPYIHTTRAVATAKPCGSHMHYLGHRALANPVVDVLSELYPNVPSASYAPLDLDSHTFRKNN